MTSARELQISRADLGDARTADVDVPVPGPGQALLQVESFGMSANNATYAVLGDLMNYWDFFPAPDGWGKLPVWGYARVVASESELPVGTRVFGYLPAGTHLLVTPDRVAPDGSFTDAAEHRAHLSGTYNRYSPVTVEPADEALFALLRPLFALAVLLADQLHADGYSGADHVILTSGSSKTSRATALMLARLGGGATVHGLTSPARLAEVAADSSYDGAAVYGEESGLPDGPALLVDVAGDPNVRRAVYERYGDDLVRVVSVGATHWSALRDPGPDGGPEPVLFFAPEALAAKSAELGRDGLQQWLDEAWTALAERARGWLRIERRSGPDAMRSAYLEALSGEADPALGVVVEP